MSINFLDKAAEVKERCVIFLRDIIAIPSESTHEEEVAKRIKAEMDSLGFDDSFIDDYGNVIGRVGSGPIGIVYDGHIDTVGIGHRESWNFDPYLGKIEDGHIYGRGACDNKAATAVQIYGLSLLKNLCPETLSEYSIYVVGSIQEEDCDGLGLKFALEHSIGNVHYVCLGESTDLDLYRGHRGRMEIKVESVGRSCHGSAPERGINAIYKMNKLVMQLAELNGHLKEDSFLGKGSLAVTDIKSLSPSLCAVPDKCEIHIDRRLTAGETKESALLEIKSLASFDESSMHISIPVYARPSYKGKVLQMESFFPTWSLAEDHPLVKAGFSAAKNARAGDRPKIDRWIFSTNGVTSMGHLNIPTIGFGPAKEEDAHTADDRVKISDLVTSIAFYAQLPLEISKEATK